MDIRGRSFEAFLEEVKAFHGYPAPGVLLGGKMIETAYRHLPPEGIFDVLCETPKCLPDAVQLLTPCTFGNGWLTVVNVGRFALTFYEKEGGKGIRVFVDPQKLEPVPELKAWFLKLKPKQEQDTRLLLSQIREKGSEILRVQEVQVAQDLLVRKRRGLLGVCPACGEGYPLADGPRCRVCSGTVSLYR